MWYFTRTFKHFEWYNLYGFCSPMVSESILNFIIFESELLGIYFHLLQFIETNGKTGQQQSEIDCDSCWYFGDKFGVCCGASWFNISNCQSNRWPSSRCIVFNVCFGNDQSIGQYKGTNCNILILMWVSFFFSHLTISTFNFRVWSLVLQSHAYYW